MFIVRKYADFKRSRQKEADKQAQAEIELRHLSDKIASIRDVYFILGSKIIGNYPRNIKSGHFTPRFS